MITNPPAVSQLTPPVRRKRVFTLCFLCTLTLSLCASAQDPKFITFDAPGSVQTMPTGINPAGEIIGTFFDASGIHGFVRARDGTITAFDTPGVIQQIIPPSISLNGVITGSYDDQNFATHGFVRARDGTITTFDVPGAGTSPFQGTVPSSINPAGVITGSWVDTTSAGHYFVRAPDGAIATFDVPESTGFQVLGEFSLFINPGGVITGSYPKFNNTVHGFVRARDGTITTFDPAGASTFLTFPSGINSAGEIAGWYQLGTEEGVTHGFVRARDGTITTFDPPGAIQTFPSSITSSGLITGSYAVFPNGSCPGFHGFVRAPDGTITTFEVPGANSCDGTLPFSINPAGAITGTYTDNFGNSHGFLRIP